MINKKLILFTAIVATGCLQSMDDGDITIDLENMPSIDQILVAAATKMRPLIERAETHDMIEASLQRNILIVGADVTTPWAELEQMDKAEFDQYLAEAFKSADQEEPTPTLNEDEYVALRQVVKRRIWRDVEYRGLTSVTIDDYLTRASQDTRKRCITYLMERGRTYGSFIEFHNARREAQATLQRLPAEMRGALGGDTVNKLSMVISANALLGTNVMSEKRERILLGMFHLEVPATPIDYAEIITRTKQRLEELSQQ